MKHLMILRCGKNSIHKTWINTLQKIMDIAFVYYDDADFSEDNPTYSYYSKGTKLTGIHDFVTNNPDIIAQYDYFWLFEDDLILPYSSAKEIINFINIHKPALSAPTLTQDSFFSHAITLQLPSLLLRGTDFVECMSPIMSKDFLHLTLEKFLEYPMWGIERYWQHLLWELKEVAFLFDQWPIRHTRPIGQGNLYQTAAQMRINYARDDEKAFDLYTKPFNTIMNILFGIKNDFISPCLFGKKLRHHIETDIAVIEELHGNTIANFIINNTYFTNPFFSKFLSFKQVQKLLNIQAIHEEISDILVREWSFGNESCNVCLCTSMTFSLNGRIEGFCQDNEFYWKIVEGHLAITSKKYEVTTVFANKTIENNKIVLKGAFMNDEQDLRYLREN